MASNEQAVSTAASWIQKTPGVCGGDACIRTTRMPVWALVESRRLGLRDDELLDRHVVPLTQADLDAAWNYYETHRQEIEQSLWQNEAVMIEYDAAAPQPSWVQANPSMGGSACIRTTPIPIWFLVHARNLGMSDERIRDGFEPALPQADLDAAWTYYAQNRDEIDREVHEHASA